MNIRVICLILFYWLEKYVEAANILGIFIYPSYSHQIVHRAIWRALANRGHQVTVFTPNPEKTLNTSNLREIDISFMYGIKEVQLDITHYEKASLAKVFMTTQFKQLGKYSEKILQHPDMQSLLKEKNPKFDFLMVDLTYPSMIALSIKFKCPFIGISSMKLMDPLINDIGNYYHPVLYPSYFFPLEDNLSFWYRLQSAECSLWMRRFFDNEVYPKCDELVKKYLGDDYPPVKKIVGNISLSFVNSNPLFTKPRLNMPNVIEFSGLHIGAKNSLSADIEMFLNESTRSVVYFSLGSNLQSNMLPKNLKLMILETFRELPYKFLMKFEEAADIPKNIKIERWLPQQDILSHPNVKVFITQGGQQSLEEAIYYKVPLIGIPFFADQWQNMYKVSNLGVGELIDRTAITKETLKRIIIELVENQKYHKRIEQLAKLLDDTQVKPLDKVMWWIEYVIRNGKCIHLRSSLLDMPTYQYLMLDILAFFLSLILIAIILMYYTCKYIFCHLIKIYTAKQKLGKGKKFEKEK